MRKKYVHKAIAVLLILTAAALLRIQRMPEGTVCAWQGDAAFFEREGRIGLVNRRGEVLPEPMLTDAGLFDCNGLVTVAFPGGCGRLNRLGDFVHHAPGYEFVQFFSEEYQTYLVCGYGAQGNYYLSAAGKVVSEPDWKTDV